MEELIYFFRTVESKNSIEIYGIIHILIILLTLFVAFLIIRFNVNIKKIKEVILFLFIIYNITYYTWYLITAYSGLKDSLPIYICRICILIYTFNFLFKKKFFNGEILYLGFLGAIVGYIYPVMDKFSFPHFTYFTFLFAHTGLFIYSILIVKENKNIVSKTNMIKSMKMILIIDILSFIANYIIKGANYNVVSKAPFLNNIFDNLPIILYFLFASLLSILFIFIIHLLLLLIKKIIYIIK